MMDRTVIGICVILSVASGAWTADSDLASRGASASVAAELSLRDPFWPIGYKPLKKEVLRPPPAASTPPSEATHVAVKVVEPRRAQEVSVDELRQRALASLKISATMRRGARSLAVINGQVVQAGDTLIVTMGGRTFTFEIRSIDSKRVRIEPVDK